MASTDVSTHSRPKAAVIMAELYKVYDLFQHTAARRRLAALPKPSQPSFLFQHTAARRRLF